MSRMERYQVVWGLTGFGFRRYTEPSWCYIYNWILFLGIVQIRKWSNKKLKQEMGVKIR